MTCHHTRLQWWDDPAQFRRLFLCRDCGANGVMSDAIAERHGLPAWDVPPVLATELTPIEHFIKELT